jgi:RNA polymerase sigma-70 factor (ECF subfamily)
VNRAANDAEVKDAELVRRAQGGDAAAFAGLVSRYQDRVYNTCYRMCHSHADAQDATQTAFLKALEGLGRFQARSSFFTWLFRIAVNVVISERRARRRRPAVSLHEGNPDGPEREPAISGDDAPAAHVEQQESHQHLRAALDRLDDDFRTVVVLKDVEGMDYATIAQIIEAPVGTVKSRLHRGRLMLRAMLREEGIQGGRT